MVGAGWILRLVEESYNIPSNVMLVSVKKFEKKMLFVFDFVFWYFLKLEKRATFPPFFLRKKIFSVRQRPTAQKGDLQTFFQFCREQQQQKRSNFQFSQFVNQKKKILSTRTFEFKWRTFFDYALFLAVRRHALVSCWRTALCWTQNLAKWPAGALVCSQWSNQET